MRVKLGKDQTGVQEENDIAIEVNQRSHLQVNYLSCIKQ